MEKIILICLIVYLVTVILNIALMAWKPIIDRDKSMKCYIASMLLSPITLPFNINCIIVAAYNNIARQAEEDVQMIPLDLDEEMLEELIVAAIIQTSNDAGRPIKSKEEAIKIHRYIQNHEEMLDGRDLHEVLEYLAETGVLVEADGKWVADF